METCEHRQGSRVSSGDKGLPSTSDPSSHQVQATMTCSTPTAGEGLPLTANHILEAETANASSRAQQQNLVQASKGWVMMTEKAPKPKGQRSPSSRYQSVSEQPQKLAKISKVPAALQGPVPDPASEHEQQHSDLPKNTEPEQKAVPGGLASLAQAASNKLAEQKQSGAAPAKHPSDLSSGAGEAGHKQPRGTFVQKPASHGPSQEAAASGLITLAHAVDKKQAEGRHSAPSLAERKRRRHSSTVAQSQPSSSSKRRVDRQGDADSSQLGFQRWEANLQLCQSSLHCHSKERMKS